MTGGAGFIGSRIGRALVGRRDDVTVLDDLSGGSREAVPTGARLIEASVADSSVIRVVAGVRAELVIHAAAQVSVLRSLDAPEGDWLVNVDGTRHVVEGARAGGARRFVFLSSGGAIYGDSDGAAESSPPAPKSPYGRSKLAAESIVTTSRLDHGIARLANVYGPRQRSDLEGGVVAILTDRLLDGLPVEIHGSGRHTRDLVHVDDVVNAVLEICGARATGTWNVGTGQATSVLDLLHRLERLIGTTAHVEWRPARPGDITSSRLSIERIGRELGWHPRWELDAGLRAMLDEMAVADAREPGLVRSASASPDGQPAAAS